MPIIFWEKYLKTVQFWNGISKYLNQNLTNGKIMQYSINLLYQMMNSG